MFVENQLETKGLKGIGVSKGTTRNQMQIEFERKLTVKKSLTLKSNDEKIKSVDIIAGSTINNRIILPKPRANNV